MKIQNTQACISQVRNRSEKVCKYRRHARTRKHVYHKLEIEVRRHANIEDMQEFVVKAETYSAKYQIE